MFIPRKADKSTAPARRRGIWLGLVVPLVVALVAVFGITAFRSNADDRRRGQILLARVDAAANRQGVLVSTVTGLGVIVRDDSNPVFERDLKSLPGDLEALRDQMEAYLDEVSSLSPPQQELGSVEATLDLYQSVLETQLVFLQDREFDDAWIFDRERVHPAYESLHDDISATDEAYSELAESSNQVATIGTISIVGLAVALLVFLQFERGRRTRSLFEAEQRVVKDSEARFRSLVQNSSDAISITSDDLTARYHSPAIESLLGVSAEDGIGKKLTDHVHYEDVAAFEDMCREVLEGPHASRSIECGLSRPDGTMRDVEITVTNQLDVPNIAGLVFNARDITERKDAERERAGLERQLAHQAFHDPLTGLANRVLFRDRVDHALARQARTREDLAVLFVDLDNFKSINDSLGHEAGDGLLNQVSERLQSCLRDADTIARLGGDEFAVLLESVSDPDDVYVVADRLLEAMQMPFDLNGRHVLCGGSVGVAFSGSRTEGSEELLANADVAMYAAKARGKGCRETFRPDMRKSLMKRMDLEASLQRALENDEFVVHYQPIVEVGNGHITGVEALVRWQHPEKGLIAPGDFIPVAEETGLIIPIGRWVLEQACYQARVWQAQYVSRVPLKISVNLSVRQFQQTNIVGEVAEVLRASKLPPSSLVLEVTESILVQDSSAAVRKLQELKALGVQLALDDFGTGYSSLSYLRRFPIDVLKIDKSFIDGVGRDAEDSALTRAIVQIGETLHLRTVAEGIEYEEQALELESLGCEEGQGYYFARPLDAESVAELLARNLPEGISAAAS